MNEIIGIMVKPCTSLWPCSLFVLLPSHFFINTRGLMMKVECHTTETWAAVNYEGAQLYEKDPEAFNRKAKRWTERFATGNL